MPKLWLGHGKALSSVSWMSSPSTLSVATFSGWPGTFAQSTGRGGNRSSGMVLRDVWKQKRHTPLGPLGWKACQPQRLPTLGLEPWFWPLPLSHVSRSNRGKREETLETPPHAGSEDPRLPLNFPPAQWCWHCQLMPVVPKLSKYRYPFVMLKI